MKLIGSKINFRIFGMIYPLYTISDPNPGKIEAELNELEQIMHCQVETASSIVSILRWNKVKSNNETFIFSSLHLPFSSSDTTVNRENI